MAKSKMKKLLFIISMLCALNISAQSNGVLYKLAIPLKDLVTTYSYMWWSCDNYPATTVVVEWHLPLDTTKALYRYGGMITVPDSIVKLQPVDKKNTAIPTWIVAQTPWKQD